MLTNGSLCTSTRACGYGLWCTYDPSQDASYCLCTADRFWDSTTSYCCKFINLTIISFSILLAKSQIIFFLVKKYAYGATGCVSASQCLNNTNLICSSSTCTCDLTTQYWNGTYCGN